ncbi:transporter [Sphingomonas oleivorans]|uniref:Transporter n=1 Tax=Sphingomonas oleivorans TaxID=1735121 RepID=A0A2T5FVS9_9SPHN|nr:AEC family transporter [Sphingomonas oleivorans]PTQ09880.1 transporter [Sphingomonas oleivorans]
MALVLGIVAPVFGLILAGWLVGRKGLFGDGAVASLNRFVVWLALPALIFRVLAEAHWSALWQPGFIAAFVGGIAATFLLSVLLGGRDRPLAETSLDALSASYANTAFMGIPLCVATMGAVGLPAAVLASILTVCLLFAFSIMLVEYDLHRGRGIGATIARVAASLARNPLLVAPVLGTAWAMTGVPLPGPVHEFTNMLGAAATPCALVTLGLFLAEGSRPPAAPGRVGLLIALKLLIQPAVTALLVLFVFTVPPLWARAAILLAALPTGTGPFMLAQLYRHDVAVTSRAILISTICSLVTASLLLAMMAPGTNGPFPEGPRAIHAGP